MAMTVLAASGEAQVRGMVSGTERVEVLPFYRIF
ncbi:hypothetical protein RKD30_003552 [Streptomyces pristinaespiralis]